MKVYSQTDRRLMNLMLEKRTVLETRLDNLGQSSHPISVEVTALRREAEHRLDELEKAFARMEAGRYGLCETCAAEIALPRLEVLPATRCCRDCA